MLKLNKKQTEPSQCMSEGFIVVNQFNIRLFVIIVKAKTVK